MSAEPTLWSKTTGVMGGALLGSVHEIYRLIPDSILFGSLLLYFLTQNIAFGVFAIFIFETVMSHRFISWMFAQSVGPSRPPTMERLYCRSGYRMPEFKKDRMFNHDPYPSYGVYSVASIGTYLWLATKEFSKTLDSMGPEWSSRSTVAYSLIVGVVAIVFLARWSTDCQESFGELLTAILLAIIMGTIFFFINKALFGEEGMNFLGLPYLVSKESQGSPIYVCSIEKDQPKTQ
jgi:hypothetical protein